MSEHTKKHRIDSSKYVVGVGCDKNPMSVSEYLKKTCGDMPRWAICLTGMRAREGLTQVELGKILNIKQGNISQMEKGKRPIGKNLAKRLAEIFKTEYRLFL